jgi:DNA-binding transcriptional LysR family regulator
MPVDARRLVVLHAVADSGGVLAAAGALHLTASAVSQHIARLEAETGLTLLDRSRLGGGRAAGLTPAGRLLAGHAARLVAVLADAERDLAALTGAVAGTVTVAAFPTVMAHLVAPAAARVAAGAPHVRVSIVERDTEPAIAAVRAAAVDLALVENDAQAPPPAAGVSGVRVRPVLDDRYRIAVPVAWGVAADLAAVLARPWVDGPPGSATRQVLDRLAAQHGVRLRREHECLEFPGVLSIVAAGLAAAVVPALALPPQHAPAYPGVVLLDVPGVGARRISVVHRAGRHEPGPAARLLLGEILRPAQA